MRLTMGLGSSTRYPFQIKGGKHQDPYEKRIVDRLRNVQKVSCVREIISAMFLAPRPPRSYALHAGPARGIALASCRLPRRCVALAYEGPSRLSQAREGFFA